MARVLCPLPARDFDPTESAVPWRVLVDAGHEVIFATPDGAPASADDRMVTGRGLGPWSLVLRAQPRAVAIYEEMRASPAFLAPLSYAQLDVDALDRVADALLLPGGHAPGMKVYLESTTLQRLVARFVLDRRPVGAICHGVVLAARSLDENGRSVLHGKRATALLEKQELLAWRLTQLWLHDYYRTYPQTVQHEVTEALGSGAFSEGPTALFRDAPDHLERGFTVVDGALVTARWPGDAWRFAHDLATLIATRPVAR